jgi:hypothetical protein
MLQAPLPPRGVDALTVMLPAGRRDDSAGLALAVGAVARQVDPDLGPDPAGGVVGEVGLVERSLIVALKARSLLENVTESASASVGRFGSALVWLGQRASSILCPLWNTWFEL